MSTIGRIEYRFRGGDRLAGARDEEFARRFHLALISFLCWVAFMAFLVIPWFAVRKTTGEILAAFVGGGTAVALLLLRRGRERAAATVFLFALWALLEIFTAFNGGVHSAAGGMALVIFIAASWLLGLRAALAFAGSTLLVLLTEAVLEQAGHPLPVYFPGNPLVIWAIEVGIFVLAISVIAGLLNRLETQIAALEESEVRFRSLSDAALEGLMVHDHGVILDCNMAFARTFGYESPTELIGRDGPEFLLTAESRARIRQRMERVEEGVAAVTCVRKDGSTFPAETESRAIRHLGRDARLVAMSDITERKRAEEERDRLQLQLTQSQRMESIGRLAGGIAHDFNNMLTVILGYTAMLKGVISSGSKQLKYVLEIEKAGTRSKQITEKLLGFSRQQIIAPAPANLNHLVTELLEPLGRLIGEDIELSFCSGTDLWTVSVDSSQVNQILLNLAVNARDAMPSGGKLTIETENARIPEEYCSAHPEATPGDFVALTVSDTGIGIGPEILPKIFEPFFTTKQKDEGTGLGLSMVYGIAKQNGGFVNVYSEPGYGSSFRIYIPRMMGDQQTAESGQAQALTTGSATVLVVEDDELVRELVTSSLESIGYKSLTVESPAEAMELCASADGSQINLVLTDVVMPGMNGMEMRDRICAVRPGMRVLFMSGYTSNVIVKHGILKPGLHFIQKPFTVEELGRRISEVLA